MAFKNTTGRNGKGCLVKQREARIKADTFKSQFLKYACEYYFKALRGLRRQYLKNCCLPYVLAPGIKITMKRPPNFPWMVGTQERAFLVEAL